MSRIMGIFGVETLIVTGDDCGDFGPDSDLDIMVVLSAVQSTRSEGVRFQRALRGLLIPIDIIVASTEQLEKHQNTIWMIYRTVLTEGKVLYERPATT